VPNGAILWDGTIVYNSREQFNKAEKLRGIGPDSTIVWWHDPTDVTGQTRDFRKLHTISDGSILGVGQFGNRNVEPSIWEVPWITKAGDDESQIWERAYYAFRENGDTQFGRFRDAVELEDGSLMVLGGVSPLPGQGWEVLLARLDADGCLEPDCGVFNDITSYLTSTKTIDKIDLEIYPNPVVDELQIEIGEIPEKIEIYDLGGRLLIEAKNISNVNVEILQKGIYIVKVVVNGKIGVKEIVKY